MHTRIRHLSRIANAIAERFADQPARNLAPLMHSPSALEAQTAAIQRVTTQLARCARRRWHGAAKRLRRQLSLHFDTLQSQLRYAVDLLHASDREPVTAASILAELLQLDDEFGGVRLLDGGSVLAVTTDDIVLEDVPLGSFELRLDIDRMRRELPEYAISAVALNPHPSVPDDGVAHPHIKREAICLGDAAVPVRHALRDLRLADAFLITRSVLQTYNPDSAYVSLVDWDNLPCSECGGYSDSLSGCERCGGELCEDCIRSCEACSISLCGGCLNACRACDLSMCRDCLTPCPFCHESVCDACRSDRFCELCEERSHEDQGQTEDASAPAEPASADAAPLPA